MVKPTPTCLAGHGPMQRVPGVFALQGGELQAIELRGLLGPTTGQQFRTNGQMFGVQIWSCHTCSRVELFDDLGQ